MKYFKITRTWVVRAADEAEAFHLIAAEPDEYLESEGVSWTVYKQVSQRLVGAPDSANSS